MQQQPIQIAEEAIDFKWQCTKCGETADGTPGKYLSFCGIQPKKDGCSVVLIDETGETEAAGAAAVTESRISLEGN